jgi:hypothetical protein
MWVAMALVMKHVFTIKRDATILGHFGIVEA